MKILQRYTLRELLGPTFLGLLVFTFIILVNKLFRLTDLIVSRGANLRLITELLLCLIPTILMFTIPMALLVAVLIGLGRMTIDNEILAIRTSGINLMLLFTPIIIVAILLSGVMIAANYSFVPNLFFKMSDVLYQVEFQALTALQPGRFYDGLGTSGSDLTLYYEKKDPANGDLIGVNIKLVTEYKEQPESQQPASSKSKSQKKQREALIIAQRGRITPLPQQKSIAIQLFNGTIFPVSRSNPTQDNTLSFEEMSRTLRPRIGRIKEGRYVKGAREMTVPELLQSIRSTSRDKDRNRLNVELIQRFSVPLACIAFVLIGIPLAIFIRPSGKSAGFAISFALIFIYYVMLKWGSSLGEEGAAGASFAIFSPNIVLGAIGGFLIYKALRK